MRDEEKNLQSECEKILKALDLQYLHKNNNVGQKYRKGTNNTMTGLADLVIFMPKGITLHIELKTKTGLILKSQIEYRDKLIKKQHKYYICRSRLEFMEILATYGLLIL